MNIEAYLLIAGTAYRRILEVRSEQEAESTAFPRGPDDTQFSQEIAICEAIIAAARAMLSSEMLLLQFTAEGRASAMPPSALKDSEYDQGSHYEPAH